MATPIKLKRSAVAGKRPTLSDLQLGELALNTYDGSIYVERDTGGVGIATTIANVTPWTENYGGESIYYNNTVGIGTTNPQGSLQIGTGVTVYGNSGIVSATKFYGDGSTLSNLGGTLSITGDSGAGAGVALATQTLTIVGTTNEVDTSADGQQVQIGLPNNVTITNDLIVGSGVSISGITTVGFVTATDAWVSGIVTATGFAIPGGTSGQFLKANGGTDNTSYITSGEADLDLILGNGNSSSKGINVGISTLGNVSGGFVKLYDNSNLVFQTVGSGVSVSNAGLNTATIFGPQEIHIDPSPIGVGTTSGIVRIKGDLYVDGKEFIINSETITLGDFVVGIATTVTSDALTDGAGIGIGSIGHEKTFKYEYNSGTNPSLKSSENLNVASGKGYQIAQTEVLNSTTLGSGIVNSSLTNLGTLTSVNVSGNAGIGSLNVTGVSTFNSTITLKDNVKLGLGDADDLELHHSTSGAGSTSYIDNNKGPLYIRNNVDDDDGGNIIIEAKAGKASAVFQDDEGVRLYFNNAEKFATTNEGINVSGLATVTDTLKVGTAITASAGVITATSLDISGNVDVDGTLEADAITVDGSTLSSVIQGTTVDNATNAAGLSGSPNIDVSNIVGTALSISGGISTVGFLTATDVWVSGAVTATSFSGSGANLTGLTGASANTYGSATLAPVITVDANGRISNITTATISGGGGGGGAAGLWAQTDAGINTSSYVGIGTTNPLADLQVGTGVTVYGNVGIVSATTFKGDLEGDVTGNADTATNASGLTGSPDINVSNIVGTALSVSGIATVTDTLKVGTAITATAGIITANTIHLRGGNFGPIDGGSDSENDAAIIVDENFGIYSLEATGGWLNTLLEKQADVITLGQANTNKIDAIELIPGKSGITKLFAGDGTSTPVGILTANESGVTVSGILTATSFVKNGGTSTQFLKADGSVDNSTYLTAESDTLDSVLGRGNSSTKGMNVGISTLGNVSDGFVKLYHNSNLVFETTGIGVSVVGIGSTAYIEGPEEIWIDPHPTGVGTTSGIVRIRGDLYVDGTEFIVDVEKIELGDFQIGIATTAGTNALLDGAGIGIGSESIRKTITWSNSSSSLKSSENWNLASGKHYEINGTDVLTSTTLGSGVVNSSLTSLGTIATGTWQGTAVADSYVASATTWDAKLDNVVEDVTPQLGGNLDGNSKSIYGVDNLKVTGITTVGFATATDVWVSGAVTATSFDGSLATTNLTGTITNAQLGGSIANDKLSNNSVSYGGIELALGASDATPAFNLSDATNYPYTSLTGIVTHIVGDTTPQLGGNLDGNSKSIYGVDNLKVTGITTVGFATATDVWVSGAVTATTFDAPSYHMDNTPTRDKYRFWGNTQWVMGMDDAMSFGGLNSYAITSQVSNHDDRGWVFLDTNHTDAQGAMSLNTIGELVVAKSIRAGGGESDTSAPRQPLDIIGDGIIIGDVGIGTINPTGTAALTNNEKVLAVGVVTANTLYGSGANLTGLTGASAATYGDASNVAQIVVNSDGKITGISEVAISGGGGGGGSSLWASNDTGINTSTNVGIATTTASAILEIGSSGIATATTMINAKAWDGQTFNVDGNITSDSIFAVNDISGLPVIDYNASHGNLALTPFGGNISIGYTNSGTKLGLKGSTSERVHIVDDELSDMTGDTINIDNGNVQYFTTAENGGTLTPDITSNNTINADLAVGDSTTVVVIVKPDSTSDKITNIKIDGSAVTEEWLGGSAPDGGASGSYDVYTFFILKTADATFLPLCNKVNYA